MLSPILVFIVVPPVSKSVLFLVPIKLPEVKFNWILCDEGFTGLDDSVCCST